MDDLRHHKWTVTYRTRTFDMDVDAGGIVTNAPGCDWAVGRHESWVMRTFWGDGGTCRPSEARGRVKGIHASGQQIPVTTAHLVQTVSYDLTHAARHLDLALGAGDRTSEQRRFDSLHAQRHVASAIDHASKLAEHLRRHYPKEGGELGKMSQEAMDKWSGAQAPFSA